MHWHDHILDVNIFKQRARVRITWTDVMSPGKSEFRRRILVRYVQEIDLICSRGR